MTEWSRRCCCWRCAAGSQPLSTLNVQVSDRMFLGYILFFSTRSSLCGRQQNKLSRRIRRYRSESISAGRLNIYATHLRRRRKFIRWCNNFPRDSLPTTKGERRGLVLCANHANALPASETGRAKQCGAHFVRVRKLLWNIFLEADDPHAISFVLYTSTSLNSSRRLGSYRNR